MGNYHIKVYPIDIERKYNNRKVRPVLDSYQIIHSNQDKYGKVHENWINVQGNDFIPMFIYDNSKIEISNLSNKENCKLNKN
jgi:hypothetical protein